MLSAKDYEHQIEQILGSQFRSGKIDFHIRWQTQEEAKQQLARIRQIQKELRLLKKSINTTVKAVRSSYIAKKAQIGTGIGAGLMAGLVGKRTAGKMNAIERENLRRRQLSATAPYESVIRIIDDVLVKLDSGKIQIETYMATKVEQQNT